MFGFMPAPQYLPCPECGAAVIAADADEHECDDERRVNHQMLLLRHEIGRFEWEFRLWLASAAGKFACYWAEHDRLRSRSD
jgi:hypothetical protein